MVMGGSRLGLVLLVGVLLVVALLPEAQCGVTYDRKAIVINGQRRILISGSIHYPRSTPEVWPTFSLFSVFLNFFLD